jgi:hypothetical protein
MYSCDPAYRRVIQQPGHPHTTRTRTLPCTQISRRATATTLPLATSASPSPPRLRTSAPRHPTPRLSPRTAHTPSRTPLTRCWPSAKPHCNSCRASLTLPECCNSKPLPPTVPLRSRCSTALHPLPPHPTRPAPPTPGLRPHLHAAASCLLPHNSAAAAAAASRSWA